MSTNPDGYLGMILGAAVGALLDQGHGLAEIHQWVDLAAKSRDAARPLADALKGASDGR